MEPTSKAVIVKKITKLAGKGQTAAEIAETLNADGITMPKGGKWSGPNVATFKSKHGIAKISKGVEPVVKTYSGKTEKRAAPKKWKTITNGPVVTVIRGDVAQVADLLRALA